MRCDCCWQIPEDNNILGDLAMPNRRIFRVCQECVNYMWHGRHPIEQETSNE